MPLYEYRCTKCGHQFEAIQKFSDPLKTKCPKCGGRLEKLPSAPAVHFKGSGWYVTDYGKGNAAGSNTKPESRKSKDESAASAEKNSGKSSGKPADKPAEKPAEKKPEKKTGGSKD